MPAVLVVIGNRPITLHFLPKSLSCFLGSQEAMDPITEALVERLHRGREALLFAQRESRNHRKVPDHPSHGRALAAAADVRVAADQLWDYVNKGIVPPYSHRSRRDRS